MRKQYSLLAGCAPVSAFAQPLHSAVQGLSGFIGNILPIMIVIMVAIGIGFAAIRGQDFFKPLLMIVMLPVALAARSILSVIAPYEEASATPSANADEPGALDWIADHWLPIVLVVAAIAASAYAAIKHFDRRERLRQVKEDRAELLVVLGQVHDLLQLRIAATRVSDSKIDLDRFNDAHTTLTAIRDRLTPLLEFVQDGHPLTIGQRAMLSKNRVLLNESAKPFARRAHAHSVGTARSAWPATPSQKTACERDRVDDRDGDNDGLLLAATALAILGQNASTSEPADNPGLQTEPSCPVDQTLNDLTCIGTDAQY